eukprot:scaffold4162_cov162-Amphora_coffeaeformis.AAC.19
MESMHFSPKTEYCGYDFIWSLYRRRKANAYLAVAVDKESTSALEPSMRTGMFNMQEKRGWYGKEKVGCPCCARVDVTKGKRMMMNEERGPQKRSRLRSDGQTQKRDRAQRTLPPYI